MKNPSMLLSSTSLVLALARCGGETPPPPAPEAQATPPGPNPAERRVRAVTLEADGKHADALAELAALDAADPWVKAFCESIALMQSFDEEGLRFVRQFNEFTFERPGISGELKGKALDKAVKKDLADIKQFQVDTQAFFERAKLQLAKAAATSPDNQLAVRLKEFFEGKGVMGDGVAPIDMFSELGRRYQLNKQVDLAFYRNKPELLE